MMLQKPVKKAICVRIGTQHHLNLGMSNMLPKKEPYKLKVEEDIENFVAFSKVLIKDGDVRTKDFLYVFLLHWSHLEEFLLPCLIRQIAFKLSFKEVPKINEGVSMSQMINYYYFLSHDLDLYKKLIVANKKRNKILHKFEENHVK